MTQSLPESEYERQLSVNNFWSCIMHNKIGEWSQKSTYLELAAVLGR